MAESTLTSTYADIQQIAGLEMGWGRDSDLWTTTNETDFGIACKEGYRQFLYPVALPGENKSHNWSFLYPLGSISIGPETGSGLTVTAGGLAVVQTQDASTTFYRDAAEGTLTYTEGSGRIESYVTYESVQLDDSAPAQVASSSWTLDKLNYNLPDDFGGMVSDSFAYRRDEQWHLPQIKVVGEAEIRKVDRVNDGNVYPRWASILPLTPTVQVSGTGGASSRWMVRFYPKAEQTYELEYRYHAIPPALDASTNIYHYGGAEHSQTIIAAVMDALYRRVRSSNEKQEEFQNRLRQSILHDRRNYQTGNLGQKLRYADGKDALRDFRENTPTGNITTTFYT